MIKRIAIIVMALFALTIPFLSPKASASIDQTYLLNACSDPYLSSQNWGSAHNYSWSKSLNAYNDGGGTLALNNSSDSYIMFKQNLADNANIDGLGHKGSYNRYTVIKSNSGKLTLYKDATTNQYYVGNTTSMTTAEVRAEPNTDLLYKFNWTGGFSSGQWHTGNTGVVTTSSTTGGRGMVIGNDIYSCQVGAQNVVYASSWDIGQFTKGVAVAPDTTDASCSIFDVGCWVGDIFSGLTSILKDVFNALTNLFVKIFVPDGNRIKTGFDDLNTFMTAKLGFLAYPFTFIGNVFNAFTSGSSWCNTSSCSKDFGNLFGHAFTVNLGQMQATMPTVWTWFIAMIRGITILTLLLAVRGKYRQVTTR